MEKVSKSLEDYLEAIVMLGGSCGQPVRSVDIASKLGVSKVAVNRALVTLKDRGYVNQPKYGDITLTDRGFEYGTSVLERHKLLFAFLSRVLGIPEERAENEACLMEHAISDESFEKWRTFITAYFDKEDGDKRAGIR